MNLIRLDVWSSLNLKREKLWLAELQGLFQKFRFETHTDIAVRHRDGSTNLDLLVLDYRNKAGIAFEVKWFNEPEGMNEVRIADRVIRKGFGQAARCRDWLNARTLSVAQASGIPKQDLPNYRFMGAVLSRNTFGGGAQGVAEVPVLNERLLRSLLGRYDDRGFDLTALWKDACDRTFLPKESVHFRTSDLEVHFAGYHFIAKSIGFEPPKPWAME